MKLRSVWRFMTLTLGVVLLFGVVGVVPPSTVPTIVEAQGGCGSAWDARYYNSQNFSNPVWYECIQPNGSGGLTDGFGNSAIPASNFTAIYQRPVTLSQTGTYTFTATVEDGVRVYVNGQLVIDAWGDSGGPRTVTGSYNATTTSVAIFIQYMQLTGSRTLTVNWALGSGGGGGGGGTTCNTTPSFTNQWAVEFYNSPDRTGPIVATGAYPSGPLQVDFGAGSPATGVNPDNWSARFTRTVDFQPGGTVQFDLRVDDVGTIFLDNTAIVASDVFFVDKTYTATMSVSPGSHTVKVEMRDITSGAFINVNWSGASTGGGGTCGTGTGGTGGTGGVTSPTGVTATVRARVGLNLRECPSYSCNKITLMPQNAAVAVLGKTQDGVWAQVNYNGTVGWCLSEWLTFTGDFNSVPVTFQEPGFAPELGDGIPIRAVGNVRVRECPSLRCDRITYVPWGTRVLAYGKTSNGYWVKIGYQDPLLGPVVGWSYALWYFNDEYKLPLPDMPVIAE